MDPREPTAATDITAPSPEWIEAQRRAALRHVTALRFALRYGQNRTALTALDLIEANLRAMAAASATEDAP